ncbi:hypothetical protein CDIK_1683 [Cucumispora dikerogammari]|nr:hypothetical protein CDIK_1683 [Cucumispora dikerogammari]
MQIKNFFLQTTNTLVNYLFNTQQSTSNQTTKLEEISLKDLITSKKQNDLVLNKENKGTNFNNFKLAAGCQGNTLLIPLFEIKMKDGSKFPSDIGNNILTREETFREDGFLRSNLTLADNGSVAFKQTEGIKYSPFSSASRLQLLKKPQNEKLFVYIFLYLKKDTDFFEINGGVLKLNGKPVDRILFQFEDFDEELKAFFNKNYVGNNDVEYNLIFPEDQDPLSFVLHEFNNNKVTLSTTTYNTYNSVNITAVMHKQTDKKIVTLTRNHSNLLEPEDTGAIPMSNKKKFIIFFVSLLISIIIIGFIFLFYLKVC